MVNDGMECCTVVLRWGAGALRGGRLGRARLPVDARREMKKYKPMQCMKNIATCQVKLDAACFQPK